MTTQIGPPEKKKSRADIAGVAVPAGLLIGMGVGFLIDELVASMFIGLGAGLALMMVLYLLLREK